MQLSLMGILNVTPDSFSDGGKFTSVDAAVERAKIMLRDGADIIDVGGESTRPGAEPVSLEEELQRVIPVIAAIRARLGDGFQISIDTYKAAVAKQALVNGATLVNSMGGFQLDPALAKVVADARCPIVIYHIKGKPQTMQVGEIVYENVMQEIWDFFEQQIMIGKQAGISKKHFALDPGIGFGKTIEHNLEIIKKLRKFKKLGLPIVIGVSRKSHLGMILKDKLQLETLPLPSERLEASLAETAVAVMRGASIIRTHDVLQTKKFLTILEELV